MKITNKTQVRSKDSQVKTQLVLWILNVQNTSCVLTCESLLLTCIHRTQRGVSPKDNKQDELYGLIYYSKSALHVSGDVFAHHQKHLTVLTVSGSVHPSCCRHQPAATWVNTTRYCKYSQMLLMMGENIARNM